jgi:hypothetical protein
VSGWDLGAARYLAGKVAGVRVPLGAGHVVLTGFTPHFRGQSRNTYKLLFNAIFAAAEEGIGIGYVSGPGSGYGACTLDPDRTAQRLRSLSLVVARTTRPRASSRKGPGG